MRITIIGSGNVATHIGAALKNAGHAIVQVYSPNLAHASLLAYHLKAEPVNELSSLHAETDLFVIAVKDDAIVNMAAVLASYQKLIVHTSGATSLQSLMDLTPLAGVLYPLQTFSKTREVDFTTVPLCIEGADVQIENQLIELARTISNNVQKVSSGQRKILHLSAVFACNFPNYLYQAAHNLLAQHQLDFNLLRPLILETAQKVQSHLPADVQTGPAIRNDVKTMQAHLGLLKDDEQLALIYKFLSQAIIKMGEGR